MDRIQRAVDAGERDTLTVRVPRHIAELRRAANGRRPPFGRREELERAPRHIEDPEPFERGEHDAASVPGYPGTAGNVARRHADLRFGAVAIQPDGDVLARWLGAARQV